MSRHGGGYVDEARKILRDRPDVRASVTAATRAFDAHRREAYAHIDAEAWRRWAEGVKNHLLMRLPDYLEQAERQLSSHGVQVHWAETAAEARDVLGRVVKEHGAHRVVKGKSMLSEELGVNDFLEARGVHVRESDLGEYIIQLLGEPPSHIVGPAIHRGVDDIRELFHHELGTAIDASPEELAAAARRVLREDFLRADLGISGGNFLVAETGTLALIENEGNIRLSTSAPPVHVALVGIEKLLPRLEDLAGFLQITSRAATGQAVGSFVSLIQGPRRPDEVDGPEHVHLILVDNGRTRLLADPEAWEALRCVRCGACLNICPVYRQTGGHPYGWAYSGPIGAILAPAYLGLEASLPLPFASSLCGACAEVCPVRIPIPDLLLKWRREAVDSGLVPGAEKLGMHVYAAAADRPRIFGAAGSALRMLPAEAAGRALPVLRVWTALRAPPRPSRRSFRTLWKEGIE